MRAQQAEAAACPAEARCLASEACCVAALGSLCRLAGRAARHPAALVLLVALVGACGEGAPWCVRPPGASALQMQVLPAAPAC